MAKAEYSHREPADAQAEEPRFQGQEAGRIASDFMQRYQQALIDTSKFMQAFQAKYPRRNPENPFKYDLVQCAYEEGADTIKVYYQRSRSRIKETGSDATKVDFVLNQDTTKPTKDQSYRHDFVLLSTTRSGTSGDFYTGVTARGRYGVDEKGNSYRIPAKGNTPSMVASVEDHLTSNFPTQHAQPPTGK